MRWAHGKRWSLILGEKKVHLEGLKQGSGDGERALGSSKPVRTAGRQILRQGRVFMKIILITVVGKKLFGAVKITPFKNSSKIGEKTGSACQAQRLCQSTRLAAARF